VLAGCAWLCAVPLAWGQGVVSAGTAAYTIEAFHFDTSPAASFVGVSSPLNTDHVFEAGWWYRIAGDSAEKFFPAPDLQDYSGATATLTWNDVDGRGFSAVKVLRVADAGGPSGHLEADLTITNGTAAPLALDVFHMFDPSLAGTFGNDSAALLTPNDHIRITDGGGSTTGEYRGIGAGAFLVRSFGLGDVASELSDTNVDDFNNSGLPFGPGDLTAGFQWTTVTLPPGGQQTYRVVVSVDTAAVPVELMAFEVE
jgi:hypothetical protein